VKSAREIMADQVTPVAFGAAVNLEVVAVTGGADFVCVTVVQVIINDFGHILSLAPHSNVVLRLHIDRHVLDIVRERRPSYALYHFSPRHSGSGCPHTTHVRTVAGGSSCVNFSQYGQTIAPYSDDSSHEAQFKLPAP